MLVIRAAFLCCTLLLRQSHKKKKRGRRNERIQPFLCVFFAERCTLGEKLLAPLTKLLEMESDIYWCPMILRWQIQYEMYCNCQNQYFLSIAWIIFNYRLFSPHLRHLLLWDETISSLTAQHQELDDGHLLGERWGRGCGWRGLGRRHQQINISVPLVSSCSSHLPFLRLPHNYPLLPPGFIRSETLVSDVWIDNTLVQMESLFPPHEGVACIFRKKKEETLICIAVCEKWPNNAAWKCCRMWNNNDDKTEETAARQKPVAFKWKYGLMEFICARQWVTAEPCCAAL